MAARIAANCLAVGPAGAASIRSQVGAYRGRKRSLSAAQVAELRQRAGAGAAKATLAREFDISRETVYQYLRTAR